MGVGKEPSFRFAEFEELTSTYEPLRLLNRLYFENNFLRNTRTRHEVGPGYHKPTPEEFEEQECFAFVRQYLREDPVPGSRHLVVANEYASKDNQYANGFIHRRIKLYQSHGLKVDLVAFKKNQPRDVYYYDGVHVLAGYVEELRGLLAARNYDSVSAHFINEEMWKTLKPNVDKTKPLIIYSHGYEVRNWTRVPWEIHSQDQLDGHIARNLRVADVWCDLNENDSPVSDFVFVSDWWRRAVQEDIGINLRDTHVIHNVIDSEVFSYEPKPAEHRFKFLWVRNGRKYNYGADMAAELLARLKKTRHWANISVLAIGDGEYFDVFDQFADDPNVEIRRGYISQREISNIHKSYGMLLVPSRWDTQGVSRDEGMSSGLIPITSPVMAIPEFVDDSVALLGDEDDYDSWVGKIIEVLESPDCFADMSKRASEWVSELCSPRKTVAREIELMEMTR